MIDKDGCLVIDFGMCLRIPYLEEDEPGKITDVSRGKRRCLMKPQGACGKLPYMSPETFKNRDPFDGELIDVWTLGTILFCMLTGNRSYQQVSFVLDQLLDHSGHMLTGRLYCPYSHIHQMLSFIG